MKLTPTHLAAIDHHLRKDNWLLNEELIAELTDHYTNAVEERLAAGQTFEQALREVHTGFGGRPGLLKMEEQYVRQLDRAAWVTFRRTFAKWFLGPKVVALPVMLAVTGWLLNQYGQDGGVVVASLYIVVFVGVRLYLHFTHRIQVRRRWNSSKERKHVLAGSRYVSDSILQWLSSMVSIPFYVMSWWDDVVASVHYPLWLAGFSSFHVVLFILLACVVEIGRQETGRNLVT